MNLLAFLEEASSVLPVTGRHSRFDYVQLRLRAARGDNRTELRFDEQ